jgi:hypothetical protein
MSRFLHFHTPDGLGISVRCDLIDTIEEFAGGGTLIRLRDGQWRQVEEAYVDVTSFVENRNETTNRRDPSAST